MFKLGLKNHTVLPELKNHIIFFFLIPWSFFNMDSLQGRVNSHCKGWSIRNKNKEEKQARKHSKWSHKGNYLLTYHYCHYHHHLNAHSTAFSYVDGLEKFSWTTRFQVFPSMYFLVNFIYFQISFSYFTASFPGLFPSWTTTNFKLLTFTTLGTFFYSSWIFTL